MKFVNMFMLVLLVATVAARADEQPPAVADPVAEAQKAVDTAVDAKKMADKSAVEALDTFGKAKEAATAAKAKLDVVLEALPKLKEELKEKESDLLFAEANADVKKDKISRGLVEAARAAAEKAKMELVAKEGEAVIRQGEYAQAENEATKAYIGHQRLEVIRQKAGEDLFAARAKLTEERLAKTEAELKAIKDNPPKAGLTDKDVEKLVEAKFKAEQDKVAAAQAKAIDDEFKKRLGEGKVVILTPDDVRKIIQTDLADKKSPLGALAKEVDDLRAIADQLAGLKNDIERLKPGKEPTVRGNPDPMPMPMSAPIVTPPVPAPVPQPVSQPMVPAQPFLITSGYPLGYVIRRDGHNYSRLRPGESLPAGLPRCPLPPGAEIFVPR